MAFDADGALLWQDQHGTTATEFGVSIATDAAGNAYFLGRTQGTYPMAMSAGSNDVIVRAYDADGAVLYTTQFGTSGIDDSMSISAAPDGRVFAVGVTQGTFSGEDRRRRGRLPGRTRRGRGAGRRAPVRLRGDRRGAGRGVRPARQDLPGTPGRVRGQTPSGPSDIFVMSLLPSP